MMPTTIIYPGTFDPLTNGHVDIAVRAGKLFDKVIVAVAANPQKQPLFHLDERVALATQIFAAHDHITVMPFDGLLVAFVKQQNAAAILRGLRAVTDFDYEFQLAGMNRQLDASIETLFLTPHENYTFISASMVKEVARLGGDFSQFVHPVVADALKEQFK
ncbi:MAG: phosphopantetheine adenylyltransferase [marine bacterium B5-7]|nr:MAG: phosphopantetheine adenylyltransferase [marine bacterium B5-7]